MAKVVNENLNKLRQMLSEELTKSKEKPVKEEVVVEQSAIDEFKKLIREAAPKIDNATPQEVVEIEDTITRLSNHFMKTSRPAQINEQDSLEPLNQKFVTFEQMNRHYTDFLTKIQTQLSSLGGGGEVDFRYLDDVKRSTMTSSNDNWVLEYDAASGDVQFTNQIGPVDLIYFDRTHTHEEERLPGTLCWDPSDQTLNIEHPGGVTQQVGQESYAYVRNGTANTIPNGTPVMFAGAESDSGSGARLLVSPVVADGTFPSLYGLGITTQDLDPGEDGRVTVWGKVRELNTNSFEVGDILYADPDNPGQLTNVKPTAPDNVIPFAAVLKKGITDGEIFVRPTIEQMMYYGRFSRLTDFTVANSNQAYAIPFDTVDISNGIVFNGGTDTQISVPSSGFYQFDVSTQVTATSNKGIVYIWFRKNGTDIPHSTRASTVTNGDTFNISTSIQISLDTDDYVEVMWARTAAGILLDASTATAFAPSTSAITLNVTQVQL